MKQAILLVFCIFAVVVIKAGPYDFPPGFEFGVASAAYQVEGGWNASGKGENIWDRLTHAHPDWIADGSNGDIACDSYNKWADDVQIVRDLGVNYYRFSLSWSRILPTGYTNVINEDGISYYNNLINGLLAAGIQPFVTLYHWDLPQPIQDIGGWTNEAIAQYYEDYADIAFSRFGDRVKRWLTFNEPYEICENGYSNGVFAPALNAPGVGGYLCGRTLLLSHARAYRMYYEKYKPTQNGTVGITISSTWSEPKTTSPEDMEASERAMLMGIGWWSYPIFSETGDYPPIMKERVDAISEGEGFAQSRLPPFSPEEIEMIKGSSDFFGVNHYSSWLVSLNEQPINSPTSYGKDVGIMGERDPDWPVASLPWLNVVPFGFRKLLAWIKNTYNNPPVYVTENGYCDIGGLDDQGRIDYYSQYLNALLEAVHLDGCNVKAYTAWSVMDNMEWREGYTAKFGLYEVNFNDANRTRTPKASAAFYKEVITTNTVPERKKPSV